MEETKLPISVIYISYNEERIIEKSLAVVSNLAKEIIFVDSFSTDKTVEIAKKYGAKVYQEEWKGYINQKNSAIEKCTQPWILALDCDEVPDEILLKSIADAVKKNEKYGYLLRRKTFYLGKLMRRSWQPDWKLRLVPRECNPRWVGIEPHDKLNVELPTKKLRGSLIHYSFENVLVHFQKTIKYANLSAQSYYVLGKRTNLFKIFVNPFFAFVRAYLINKGFVDGVRGFIAAVSVFISTFLKYVFLWEIELLEDKKK
ncbi:MAG: glycosyltransferase family 2 protein [Candidatus Kapaibacteriota bacterium]